MLFLFIPCFENFEPITYGCFRSPGHLWWERYGSGIDRCEVADNNDDNEECGICGRKCYNCASSIYSKSSCWHFNLSWLYDFQGKKSTEQECIKMDHCSVSYRATEASIKKVCGGEMRGRCRSAYGSYTCECKESFQGRDCTDTAPEGKVSFFINFRRPIVLLG